MEGQIGLEETPEQYVAALVEVFRELRRVLRDDGTLFLNLGDSYWGSGQGYGDTKTTNKGHDGSRQRQKPTWNGDAGLKPKDLIGIPWMVAFALRADGWILRSEIIWHKPNCMPESVTDRPTKAHETVFLLSKCANYYYDHEAVKEAAVNGDPTSPRGSAGVVGQQNAGRRDKQGELGKRTYTGFNARWDARAEPLTKRNKRSVWTIPTQPYDGAHFAVMPEALVEPCILAGCSEGGVVVDMFGGAATVGVVAKRLNRRYLLSEINAAYVELARDRLAGVTPMLAGFAQAVQP